MVLDVEIIMSSIHCSVVASAHKIGEMTAKELI